jgi:hypothetical protein
MTNQLSLDELWDSASSSERTFQPEQVARLSEPARRYLEHAIAPGTQLAQAVRLHMHGEIKLQRWLPFTAQQVIVWDRGFIWSATVRMFGMPIRGSDRLVDGQGAMRWKLFGVIPVMTASGPDITHSAAGRVAGEAVWLPSVLCDDGVSWTAADSGQLKATFKAYGETLQPELVTDDMGRLKTISLSRWGNPEGAQFHYVNFGAIVESERTFGGYTIPTRLRAGWHFGTDRFESEGEFFQATIDEVTYR